MSPGGRWFRPALLVALVATAACTTAAGDEPTAGISVPSGAPAAPETTPPPPPTVPTTAATVPPTVPPRVTPPAPPPSQARTVTETAWSPFAAVGAVTLLHPARRVERVAFHESNHDGAQQLEPLPTAAAPVTLETRERGTGSRTAADVVVDPSAEIRAPVTGRVKRAGTYVLYCDNSDDYVVIEPDSRPGWEVKILHISGVRVRRGQRVTAGETVLAPRPTQLPFESQVDELRTADPAWPHVHIEVVDIAIPDRRTPGKGCS